MLQTLKNEITALVEAWLIQKGIEQPMVVLERTADVRFGEYSLNSAMRYARELKQPPLQIAQELTEHLQAAGLTEVERVEFVPPGFVNIYFTQQVFIEHVEDIMVRGTSFGQLASHHGEKWVIEHTSPNPNKAMHLGHLRNNLVGMGLVRLLEFAGAEVVSDCIYNDRGIAIAKVMYGFLVHMRKSPDTLVDVEYFASNPTDWHTPADLDMKPDVFVEQCYV